ncbi:MAG: LacI family DNA-binding transcriptional regulator [Chloroflexota bacterium]|jgi:DNA-binding LacI/PurR family transcriptional regulator
MTGASGSSKPATIREVAARAGVSTATVSRALRGAVGVEPTTRERVMVAARELRYRPSAVARSLKLRFTRTLGLIVTDIENPYFPQLVRSVEDAARARGYSVVLADGRRDPDREIQSLELLAERQVDGLLIASSALTERHRDWIEDRPCPVVVMNSISSAESVPAVLSDNHEGGRLAAEHLLALGHRQLALIATPAAGNLAVAERVEGARTAMARAGFDPGGLLIIDGDGSVEGGERAARAVLESRPEVTALICYNDLTAVGAMRGAKALLRRVPETVSVIGFDDIELAPYVDPPLTTVRQHTDVMGYWAVGTLLELIASGEDQAAEAAVKRIPVEVVVRESTGPAPGCA